MKYATTFSAILGIAFLAIRFVGLFIELSHNNLFLMLGLGLLLLVSIPLYLLERYRYSKMKQSIFHKYKKDNTPIQKEKNKKKSAVSYPAFRRHKKGLTWDGGSVHGSSARRGERKGFLKH